MIKSISVTNHLGESITLELTRPEKSGFIVLNADELLEPVRATINRSRMANLDGATYNSSYLEERIITLNLRFMETSTETIEDIRLKSYKYFPERKEIKLVIRTDKHTVETHGYVEHNKPNIFTNEENTSITIICMDPYLYSNTQNAVTFSGVTPMFSFPFSNEYLKDEDGTYPDESKIYVDDNGTRWIREPSLEFGAIENKTEADIYYDGDSQVGMTIDIHAIGPVGDLTVYNVTTRKQMRIDSAKLQSLTGSGIIAGDTIMIETKPRHKSITLLRDGNSINILNCLDRGTDWLTLEKGDNIIAYRAVDIQGTGDAGSQVQFRVVYKNAYEGV